MPFFPSHLLFSYSFWTFNILFYLEFISPFLWDFFFNSFPIFKKLLIFQFYSNFFFFVQSRSHFIFLPILQGTAPTDQRSLVAKQISKGIGDKEHQLELCVDSLENASYVLWRHLDHFVNTPSTRQRVGNIFEFIFEFIFRQSLT